MWPTDHPQRILAPATEFKSLDSGAQDSFNTHQNAEPLAKVILDSNKEIQIERKRDRERIRKEAKRRKKK